MASERGNIKTAERTTRVISTNVYIVRLLYHCINCGNKRLEKKERKSFFLPRHWEETGRV